MQFDVLIQDTNQSIWIPVVGSFDAFDCQSTYLVFNATTTTIPTFSERKVKCTWLSGQELLRVRQLESVFYLDFFPSVLLYLTPRAIHSPVGV
jgi:hypothetical protein